MPRQQSLAQFFQVAKQKTLEATHKVLVETAKREHARVMNTDPRPTSFQTIVDGVPGAAFESARPDGVIVVRYPRIEAIVQFAMETLFDLSPVLSGEYRNSHTIFVNQAGAANLKDWRPGQEVAITNPVPYARVIEIGKMKMKVPGTDRVYQQARRKVMARFGNQFDVQFTYRALVDSVVVNQDAAFSRGRWRAGGIGKREATGAIEKRLAKGAHNKSDVRFPCLIITER